MHHRLRQRLQPTLLGAALASVCAPGYAAQAAQAAQAAPTDQPVRCLDRSGKAYTMPSQPGAAYGFFVHCEPVGATESAVPAVPAVTRAAQFARWRQAQSVLVSWPSLREPSALAAWRSEPLATTGAARTAQSVVQSAMAAQSARAEPYLPVIRRVAASYDLDPHYLKAVMHTESAFDRNAVSPKGAMGLMQLMPATAKRFGVADPEQLRDPEVNVEAAARYLSHLRRLFDGNWTLITAAYNAGEGAVRRHGNQVPPFAETQQYVRLVDARLQHYSGAAAVQ